MTIILGSELESSVFCRLITTDIESMEGRILCNLSVVDLCNLGCCCKYLKRILNSSKFNHVWDELWRGILRQPPRWRLLRWVGVVCHMEHSSPTRERPKGRKTSTSPRSIVLRAVHKGVSVAKFWPAGLLSKLQSERGPVLGLRADVLQMGIKVIIELNRGLVTHTTTVVESSSKSAWVSEGLLVEPGMLKHNTRTFALASTLRVPELPPDESLQSVCVYLVMGNVKDHKLLVCTSLDSAKRVTTSQDGFTLLATHDDTEGCTLSAVL